MYEKFGYQQGFQEEVRRKEKARESIDRKGQSPETTKARLIRDYARQFARWANEHNIPLDSTYLEQPDRRTVMQKILGVKAPEPVHAPGWAVAFREKEHWVKDYSETVREYIYVSPEGEMFDINAPGVVASDSRVALFDMSTIDHKIGVLSARHGISAKPTAQ